MFAVPFPNHRLDRSLRLKDFQSPSISRFPASNENYVRKNSCLKTKLEKLKFLSGQRLQFPTQNVLQLECDVKFARSIIRCLEWKKGIKKEMHLSPHSSFGNGAYIFWPQGETIACNNKKERSKHKSHVWKLQWYWLQLDSIQMQCSAIFYHSLDCTRRRQSIIFT